MRSGEYAIWDANLSHGDLRPFACPQEICEGHYKTLYPQRECCCAGFENCADPVNGFCQNQHFYIKDRMLYQATTDEICNGGGCLAGAPKPEPPTAACSCNGECDSIGYFYVVTYTTLHAGVEVEGSPSAPSNYVVCDGNIPNATITVPDFPDGYCVVRANIYRVESNFEDGTTELPIEGSEFVFVASVDAGGSFVDSVPTAETGWPLITGHPETHPAPEVDHLARTEDGIVVADKCRVYISRPGEPMFSYDGIISIDDEIRHIEAIGNTILVLTDKYPVRITYKLSDSLLDPVRVTVQRNLPLSSHASVSTYGQRMYFWSEYGFYMWDLGGYGDDIKHIPAFSREQERAIHPDSVVGVAGEFGYFMFSRGLGHGFFVEVTDTVKVMPLSARLLAGADDLTEKGMEMHAAAINHDGHIIYEICGKVYGWDYRREVCRPEIHEVGVGRDCCPWTAMLYYDSEGKNEFNFARWEFDERTGTIDMQINEGYFGRHVTIDTMEVIESRSFGIQGYSSANTHWIKAESCAVAHEFRMATSNSELVSRTNQEVV